MANVAYSVEELEHQLESSRAKVLFTCAAVLENALKAAKTAGIPEDRIFVLELAEGPNPPSFKTVDDLIDLGRTLPELEPLRWCKGQGARQAAFLCYSSGTSGLPVSRSPIFPFSTPRAPWKRAAVVSRDTDRMLESSDDLA